jgi:hypothetical protein
MDDVISPFTIAAEHLEVVANYENFQIVGAFLEKQEYK